MDVKFEALSSQPIGPLTVQPLQADHGASIAICHAERGIVAIIEPINKDDDPDMDTAKREPWDEAYARLFAAAPEMLSIIQQLRPLVAEEIQKGFGLFASNSLDCIDAAIAKAEGR